MLNFRPGSDTDQLLEDAFNAGENRYSYDTGYRSGRDYEQDLLNRYGAASGARTADNANLFQTYDRNAQNARDAESALLNRTQLGQSALSADNSNLLARYGLTQQGARDAETALLNRAQMGQSALSADNNFLLSRYGQDLSASGQREAARQADLDNAYRNAALQYQIYGDQRDYGLNRDQLAAQIEAERAANELSRNQLNLGSTEYDLSRGDQLGQMDFSQLLALLQQLGI